MSWERAGKHWEWAGKMLDNGGNITVEDKNITEEVDISETVLLEIFLSKWIFLKLLIFIYKIFHNVA